jgi:type IV secretion system protein VirB10
MNEVNQQEPGLHALEGERGIPSVNERGPSTATRGVIVFFIVLFIVLAGSLGYWKYQINLKRNAQNTAQKDLQITSGVPARTFTDLPVKTTAPTTQNPAVIPVVENKPPIVFDKSGHAQTADNQPQQVLDKSGSAMMVGGAKTQEAAALNGHATNPLQRETPGEMAALLTSTRTPPSSADTLGNRNFILAKGSFIDCALQTRLDSTVPGMTACVITRNIYSDNGKVLLLERGSTVTGEYQSNMKQGMARIFVLWNRIKTPNGIVIELDSPGTDQLGGSGLPGYVDNHFWDRFGGALLLTLINSAAQGLSSYVGNLSSQAGLQQNFNGSGGGSGSAQNVATEALRNTINIPPTLYKNQGEQVGIYVARDLNFSSVYDVSAAQ